VRLLIPYRWTKSSTLRIPAPGHGVDHLRESRHVVVRCRAAITEKCLDCGDAPLVCALRKHRTIELLTIGTEDLRQLHRLVRQAGDRKAGEGIEPSRAELDREHAASTRQHPVNLARAIPLILLFPSSKIMWTLGWGRVSTRWGRRRGNPIRPPRSVLPTVPGRSRDGSARAGGPAARPRRT
jgi:hypothetical protein